MIETGWWGVEACIPFSLGRPGVVCDLTERTILRGHLSNSWFHIPFLMIPPKPRLSNATLSARVALRNPRSVSRRWSWLASGPWSNTV
jgi:hypothetical protein